MLLAEFLPQADIIQTIHIVPKTMINDEMMKSDATSTDENSCSISPIKIPLVSFKPILATSSKYILVNEVTKRKNQLVLVDDYLQKSTIRHFINESMLDALWYDQEQQFLLLTSTNIFAFDPNTKVIGLIDDLLPIENKEFKCFTLFNQSTLIIAYNEWSGEYIDKWKQKENGQWSLLERQSLKLSHNEIVGNMITGTEDDCSNLMITIYNDLTEQWRMEIRDVQTLMCKKSILLPGLNGMHDYRMILIKSTESNIKWLVFSSANANIIAMDSEWKKITLNYTHPVQRMALFNDNYLIVRTTQRIDIHLFV